MQSEHKLLLRPEQIVMIIDYSNDLFTKLNELDDDDGPRSEFITQRMTDLSNRLEATDEYKRLLQSILDLNPSEARELCALTSVGEKSVRINDFIEQCRIGPEGRDPSMKKMYLMNRVLFESIPLGLAALTQSGVIEENS